MIEPVYSFVKGKGWQLEPGLTFTCRCGTVIRVEKRNPNEGEPYYRDDKTWKLDASFQKHVGMFRFKEWSVWRELYQYRNDPHVYYTLVPV